MIADLIKMAMADNVADEIDDDELLRIGRDVVERTEEDDESRHDWTKKAKDAMDMVMQFADEEKNHPWPDASNVKYPLITVAALQFHARAYPTLIQGNKVVKGQVIGEDKDGQKMAAAQRVASHMNYQLLEESEEWEEGMDRLLLALPIEGCEFKKTYYNGENDISEWVRPDDLIVNYKTKSFADCPRITHRFWLSPQKITERVSMGVWSDVDLHIDSDDTDKEVMQEFYEQHCLLDLDGDGYKEPWCVTVHVDSQRVVRIKGGFYPDGVTLKFPDGTKNLADLIGAGIDPQQLDAEIAKIERHEYFTKYTFIPSPDGGFYDMGFGHLVGPLGHAINTNINQLIDAGTLANLPGGFVREGARLEQGRGILRFSMGEFKPVQLPAGSTLSDSVFQLSFPGPNATLFSLLGMLLDAAKQITSVQDIMTGGQEQRETATTTMARIEQGLKVFTAIYKRVFRSMKKEFKKIYDLNAIYLEPETYYTVVDSQDPGVVTLSDYRNDGTNIRPVADPNLATTMQKVIKAQLLRELKEDPGINIDEINFRYLDAIEIPNPEAVIIPPAQRQAPPDHKMIELDLKAREHMLKAEKQQWEIEKLIHEMAALNAKAIDSMASAEAKEVGSQLESYRFQLDAIKVRIESMMEARNAEQGRLAAMAGGPGNQGGNGQTAQIPGSQR